MRTVLVGAVASTQVALEALTAVQAPPELVLTLPPELGHRHSDYVDLAPLSRRLGVRVDHVQNINDSRSLELVADRNPDYVFVIGWSQICREAFLSVPRSGAIGYHPAALPANRGRAVIPWTILQNASETGSTLFWLDAGVDSGPILRQRRFPVDRRETAETLYAKHMEALATMFREVIPVLQSGSRPAITQTEAHATYCAKRTPADGYIDWNWPVEVIDRLVRATTKPYPGAFTFASHQKVIVWRATPHHAQSYSALPGQILYFENGSPVVRCGDGRDLLLASVELVSDPERPVRDGLRVHQRLGFPPVWMKP